MAGKRLRNIYKGFNRDNAYSIEQAVEILKNNAKAKFDETIEIALNLNIDAKKADQNLRAAIQLPNGSGKTYRVAVFARGDKAEEAKKAGADIVGSDDLMSSIQNGEMNFDRCIATPDMMALVGRVGKILGPRGLMPNPKLGTVTNDVAQAVAAVKGGTVEYRNEKSGIIHARVGKISFSNQALVENIKFFVDVIVKSRPSGVKGNFIKKISLSSTMGPGIKVEYN